MNDRQNRAMNDNTSEPAATAPPTLFYERHYYLSYKQSSTQDWINSSFPHFCNGFHSFLMFLQLFGAARCGTQLGRRMEREKGAGPYVCVYGNVLITPKYCGKTKLVSSRKISHQGDSDSEFSLQFEYITT